MDEKQVTTILAIVSVILLGLCAIGSCLYAIPLCLIRRFRTPLNLLSLNVSIATFVSNIFWIIDFIMDTFYPDVFWTNQTCVLLLYIQTTVNCQILYALCTASLNRLFVVAYQNKALFRTRKWIGICVAVQWIFVAFLTSVLFGSDATICMINGFELKYAIFTLIILGIIPAILLAVTNSIIFLFAHQSSLRIHPTNGDHVPAPALSQRDTRLLKHMIFMFVVVFIGWIPLYILVVLNWNYSAIPSAVFHGLRLLPIISLLITIVDLFWYNHELRRYFTA